MEKALADTLSIAIASRVIDVDPKVLLPYNDAVANADEMATFISKLSARLQADVSHGVSYNSVSFLIKN